MSLFDFIRLEIQERLIVKDTRRICEFFDVNVEKTSAWREIFSAYNPISALSTMEELFENAYLRTPRGHKRNRMLFFYLIRMDDIPGWINKYSDWPEKKQAKFRRLLGHSRRIDMLRYLEPLGKHLREVFPG